MTLPLGDARYSLAMVGSGEHPLVDQGNNRRSKRTQDPLFPWRSSTFPTLVFFHEERRYCKNGMVEGCLLLNQSTLLPLVGIIVKE